MKIVIAPDSFKGNIRSPEVCEIIAGAIRSELPDAEVVSLPMADGGEGTTQAMTTAWQGELKSVTVTGPLGEPVEAIFGVHPNGSLAVMEMASASGIELLSAELLNPMLTTSFGTGELIAHLIDLGIRDIVVGIGGSATVDGGVGMAQALGWRILDRCGQQVQWGGRGIADLAVIDASKVHPELGKTRIRVACDVRNPLVGATGAARVYGPQKGATPEMVEKLESGLAHLLDELIRHNLVSGQCAGDGAAGGLGIALRAFCGAELVSGAELVAEAVGLADALAEADLLITGEGRTDGQSLHGKLCASLAELSRKNGVPVALVSGALAGDTDPLLAIFDYALSISSGHGSLKECLAHSRQDLAFTTRNLCRLIGGRVGNV